MWLRKRYLTQLKLVGLIVETVDRSGLLDISSSYHKWRSQMTRKIHIHALPQSVFWFCRARCLYILTNDLQWVTTSLWEGVTMFAVFSA
jgi:hypothetical protein